MEKSGVLSGNPKATRAFLDTVLDRSSGRLIVSRRGQIWEAVAAAQTLGATGAGRLVAIVDGGFDLTVPGLASRLHPASRVRKETVTKTNGHGTAVALLVREVAPECELLLIDVWDSPTIRRQDVGDAIKLARECKADVLNLSLEFPTDCAVRDVSWIRVELLTSGAPPAADYVAQVQAWIDNAEPYAGARCGLHCAICDALDELPESTLVVAASGNLEGQSCPACFVRVVGVGFHRTRRVEVAGTVFMTSELPVSTGPMSRAEFVVEEPPGFQGTSFAAPLVSGFGALLPEPKLLAEIGNMSRALTPVLALANAQWTLGVDQLPDDAPEILWKGLMAFADSIPASHRHFDQESITEACAACALLLIDWYDVAVSLYSAILDWKHALGIARIAAVLAPESASVNGNHAFAAERAAEHQTDETERKALLRESVAAYKNAVRIAPEVTMYATELDRISKV